VIGVTLKAGISAVGDTVQDLLAGGALRLSQRGIELSWAESVLIASHVLGAEKGMLLAHPEQAVGAEQAGHFYELIERRARFEPIAYLIGEREFYGRSFLVDRRALIPRPETELLVEAALAQLRELSSSPLVVDVGTGSGCIAGTLALELPEARIVAVDISSSALELARLNLQRLGVSERVRLVHGDLLTWLRLDPHPDRRRLTWNDFVIVANLPYIPAEAYGALPPDVQEYEPLLALDGGPAGTGLLARLLLQASKLRIGGLLAELDPRQAHDVRAMARSCFQGRAVDVLADLAGRERLLRVGGPR
jgi:release factor glutamine methyltransferase